MQLGSRLVKLRRRFGIAAPRVAVRSETTWYLRWVTLILVLAASAVLAAWMYDAGRRFAGFDRDQAQAACKQLKRSDIACMALKI